MITTDNLSEWTLKSFNEVKSGDFNLFNFVMLLLNSDFDPKEIKAFIKKEFKASAKIVDNALKFI